MLLGVGHLLSLEHAPPGRVADSLRTFQKDPQLLDWPGGGPFRLSRCVLQEMLGALRDLAAQLQQLPYSCFSRS